MPPPPSTSNLPDVLGMITGGIRATNEVIQYAFAIHPLSITVGQAFEGLVLIQNNCDKPINAKVMLRLPRKDMEGRLMSLVTQKETIEINMNPGETGLLHLPIGALPPTQPSEGTLIGVRVETKVPRGASPVRPSEGGRSASYLSMSPFRLTILRQAGFTAQEENGYLVRLVDILAGQINAPPPNLAHRYETLWSVRELPQEQAKHAQLSEKAEKYAASISHTQTLIPLIKLTEKRFSEAGMPLHPGESIFIAKILAYAMEDGMEAQEVCPVHQAAWFQELIAVIEDDTLLKNYEALTGRLYMALIRDAVRLGLVMVEKATGESLGSADDHRVYALEVARVLETKVGIDLSHVYLPLLLAGIIVNYDVKTSGENLWGNITQQREAWRGRVRLVGSEFEWISGVLSNLLYEAEQLLIQNGIPKK